MADRLQNGTFGMTRETAEAHARAAERACKKDIGFGRALGEIIHETNCPHRDASILAAAAEKRIPLTVHVAIGTDIVHMHGNVDPARLGQASHTDFRILCSVVADLEGGVWLNVGSAVILPEVFLKGLTVARNLHGRPHEFTTANLDMTAHYRPTVNVVKRPGGAGITLIGQHEILLPLLRVGVLAKM